MSDLVKFYKDLLDLSGVEIGDFGRLYVQSGIEDIYLKIDDKFIIFPDKDFLTSPDNPKGSITFHPLSESVIRGLSEVQNLLRRCAIVHLNYVGGELLTKAIEINSRITNDTSYKPTHKISKLFSQIGDLDEKFIRFWNKLNKKMSEDSACRIFDIFMTRHGDHSTGKFDRFTSVISPLYDQILDPEDNEIFGVKAERKKDIVTLRSILDALFPDIDGGDYVSGSSSSTAPYLDSYISALVKIETRFNDVIIALGKELDSKSAIHCRGLDIRLNPAMSKLRGLIPPDKAYNVGVRLEDEKKLEEEPREKRSVRRTDMDDEPRREEPKREPPKVSETPRPKLSADSLSIDARHTRSDDDRPKLSREEPPRRDDYEERRRPSRRNDDRYDDRYDRGRERDREVREESSGSFWDKPTRDEERGRGRDRYDDRRPRQSKTYRDDYESRSRRGRDRGYGSSRRDSYRDSYDRDDRYGRRYR